MISDPATVDNPTDGTVTGGGNIGKGTSLGLEVHSDLGKKDPIKGTLEYHDRYVRLDLQSHNMTFLSVDSTGTQATFVGTGTYDRHEMHGDHKGHDMRDIADTFLVSLSDPDKTGDHDMFSITVTNSTGNVIYQNSGTVKGHIEIHNSDTGKGNHDDNPLPKGPDNHDNHKGPNKPDNGNHNH